MWFTVVRANLQKDSRKTKNPFMVEVYWFDNGWLELMPKVLVFKESTDGIGLLV